MTLAVMAAVVTAGFLVAFPLLFWLPARWIEPEWAKDWLTFPWRFWRDLGRNLASKS